MPASQQNGGNSGRSRFSRTVLKDLLIDNNFLMMYQQAFYLFRGAVDEENITLNINRHCFGIQSVSGVFFKTQNVNDLNPRIKVWHRSRAQPDGWTMRAFYIHPYKKATRNAIGICKYDGFSALLQKNKRRPMRTNAPELSSYADPPIKKLYTI